MSRLSTLLSTFFWIVFTLLTCDHFDIPYAFFNPLAYAPFVQTSLVCFIAFLCVFMYIQSFSIRGRPVDLLRWKTSAPLAIPLATGCVVGGSICWIIGMWPVWTWKTIPIGFILSMGSVTVISLFG